MKSILKFIGKLFALICLLFLLYIIVTLAYGTMTDWQPPQTEKALVAQKADSLIINDSIISFTIWNVGYGGLGAKSNFFFDNGDQMFANGRMIRSPKELVDSYIKGGKEFIRQTDSDFFLLQEVDYESKRSYFINEFDTFRQLRPSYSAAFAANYKNDRVPLPIGEPWHVYGQVHSGLATLAEYQPNQSTRYQLPGSFDWPNSIFQLDRCVLKQNFPVSNGKELSVFNIHNSAYDKGGFMKKQQFEFLKTLFEAEYAKGNYVVVGGDWNQVPPNFPFDKFMPGKTEGHSQIPVAPDAMPEDWTWVYDPTVPTNRKVKDTYIPQVTFETLIDFFLVSPNIKVKKVTGYSQNFEFSDHQPVWMEVELLD